MIKELDVVALVRPVPEHGLEAGDAGTVVMTEKAGKWLTVEFMAATGKTVAIATLPVEVVRPVCDRDISHVRSAAAE